MQRPIQVSLILFAFLILGCAFTRPHLNPEAARGLIGFVPAPARPTPLLAASVARSVPARTARAAKSMLDPAMSRLGQIGAASYYHSFFDGRTTANGETFSNQLLTAAHRTLDFGTRVRVTNLQNLKSVIVTINDRGPYVSGRIIDLSRRAAHALGFVHAGVTKVRVEILS
jgi:rare lipoprotein A